MNRVDHMEKKKKRSTLKKMKKTWVLLEKRSKWKTKVKTKVKDHHAT